jgi:hypothetical protein
MRSPKQIEPVAQFMQYSNDFSPPPQRAEIEKRRVFAPALEEDSISETL